MSYQCKDCGHVFDESEARIETSFHGAQTDLCPKCGSDNLDADYAEPEPEREETAEDRAELRGEYWADSERNGD
jgi:predicted  nucleic acid-binding Zn-ribbon protein